MIPRFSVWTLLGAMPIWDSDIAHPIWCCRPDKALQRLMIFACAGGGGLVRLSEESVMGFLVLRKSVVCHMFR